MLSTPTPYFAMARKCGAAAITSASNGSTPTITPAQDAIFSIIRSFVRIDPVSFRTTSNPAASSIVNSAGSSFPKERGVTSTLSDMFIPP